MWYQLFGIIYWSNIHGLPLPKYPFSAAVTGTLDACTVREAQTGHGAALVFQLEL